MIKNKKPHPALTEHDSNHNPHFIKQSGDAGPLLLAHKRTLTALPILIGGNAA